MVLARTFEEEMAWHQAFLDDIKSHMPVSNRFTRFTSEELQIIRRKIKDDAESLAKSEDYKPWPTGRMSRRLVIVPWKPKPTFDYIFKHGLQTLLYLLRPVRDDTDEQIVPWYTFNLQVVSQRAVYLYLTARDDSSLHM